MSAGSEKANKEETIVCAKLRTVKNASPVNILEYLIEKIVANKCDPHR